jgi:NitT/TauT family transport system substrate-binding protein
MVHWAAFSPLNVADVQGFWKDLGVSVDVTNFKSNTDLNAALENGTIDIALDMIGSWADLRLQGKPILVLGETDWSDGGDKIVMVKSRPIDSLKGKKIGVYLNLLSVQYFVDKFLRYNGSQLADFTIEQVSDPDTLSQRFIDGTYKIIANYDPFAAKAVNIGDGFVAATSRDYPGVIPEGFGARSDNEKIKNGHSDLVKIFKGWAKAVTWLKDSTHKAEFYQILKTKTFPDENLTDSDLDTNLSQVRIHTNAEQLTVNQGQTMGSLPDYIVNILEFARLYGYPSHTLTKADVLDNSAMIEALTP